MTAARNSLLVLTILLGTLFYLAPRPEVKAMDPVTISLLAPLAIQAAKVAAPYVIRGLANMSRGFVNMGANVIEMFMLPIGLGQCIFMPWTWKSGVRNLGRGCIAPLKLVGNTLMLPLYAFGFGGR